MEKDTNEGFAAVAKRVDALGEDMKKVKESVESLKSELEVRDSLEFDELRRSSGATRFLKPTQIPPPPPQHQPSSSNINNIGLANSLGNEKDKTRNNQSTNNGGTNTREPQNRDLQLYVLGEGSSSGPQLGVFSGETASAFDEWTLRFMDYLDVFGTAWSEAEKVNRLKLYLGTQVRNIFENLLPSERNTIPNAFKNIRAKLDSPHFRELAYKRLAACYQREGELVSDFIKRLVPLVNTTSSHISAEAKEEILCRCFTEKVRPEFQRSLQLVGPLIGRKDFDKLTAYVQELEVAAERDGRNTNEVIHAISDHPSQVPRGRFTTWRPISSGNTSQGLRGFNRNSPARFATSSNAQRLGYGGYQGRNQWRPQNDRRWNSRPFCHYCRRVGHDQYNCRERRANDNYNRNRGPRDVKEKDNVEVREMLDNLAVQVHEMKMSGKYASANQGNIRSLQPIAQSSQQPKEKNISVEKEEPKKITSWESKGHRVRVPTLMGISLMLIMFCNCAFAINPVLIPKGPMICQTHKQAMLWEMPDIPSCPTINLTAKHEPVIEKRRIYIPNSIEFSTKAWACRKIKKNARKYTTITGVSVEEKMTHEELEVSFEECNQMIKHHSCSLGILKENNNLWQTENKIDLTPRMWFLGSFSWKNTSSENCFLFESRIDSHFGASEVVTPLGITRDCPYTKGQCILEDKTVIIWEVDNQRKCNFIPVGEKEGRCMGSTWLSDDGRLGLTFANETIIEDCGQNIVVSDQGLGSVLLSFSNLVRNKRSPEINRKKRFYDGVATSSQLASQLTYLDSSITQAINFAFAQSLRSFCEFTEMVKHWTESTYLSDPTDLARSMFSNSYLVAKRSARSLMKVWPCVPIDKGNFEFRPTKLDHCFEFLPIILKTESNEHLAFLDPTTMIISPTSKKGPCEEFRKIIIQINDQTLEVDQIEGKITSVRPRILKSHDIKMNFVDFIPSIESHAFHQLVLLNMTDIKDHAFISNLVKVSQMTYQIHEKDSIVSTSVSNEWQEVENQIEKGLIGDYKSIWETIISILVVILALDFGLRFSMIIAQMYAGNGRLGRLIFGSEVQKAPPPRRMLDIRRVPEPIVELDEAYEEPVNRPLSISWPPSIRNNANSNTLPRSTANTRPRSTIGINRTSGFIGTLGANANTVVIDVSLNSIPVKCLIDTGAITSVANIALAEWLRTKIFKTETYLQSASEHSMCAKQATKVQLKIAGVLAEIVIHLFNDKFHWDNHDYHFILGCDAMALLPPFVVDLRNKLFRIEGSQICIENRVNRPLRNLKIYSMETCEIRPNEQCLIKARINFPELLRHNIWIHSIDDRLEEEGLSFVPVVAKPEDGVVKIILANPTGVTKRLFKGKTLGLASEVIKTESENILSETVCNEDIQEIFSLGKTGVTIDPTYKINFDKATVKGEDLNKLKELCEEFEDIFSKSQYDIGSCTAGEHDIITTSEEPVASRPHRVPFKYRDELQKHIDQLLASGVMVESDTPWVSNIVLVQKKDGGLRMVG
uniref:Peptidase A2 domain-containing protein n=1 Tax=Meloidogyne incognita TaxID=6306 RepID=A0A914MU39_MELIC